MYPLIIQYLHFHIDREGRWISISKLLNILTYKLLDLEVIWTLIKHFNKFWTLMKWCESTIDAWGSETNASNITNVSLIRKMI